MTDTTMPTEPETPCLAIEVIAVDASTATAEVRFLNPDHAGGPLTEREREVPNPATGEDQPDFVVEKYWVDEDPNPHVIKQVRVPLLASGHIDQEAWTQRLVEQARGVKARMDATKTPQAAEGAFDGFVGPVS